MVVGVSEERNKGFDGFSVESLLDLHNKLNEMEPHLCWSHAGLFSLSHSVPMKPGEWSVANDKFLLDFFFLSIFINLWIDIILIKKYLDSTYEKAVGVVTAIKCVVKDDKQPGITGRKLTLWPITEQ